MLKHVVHCTASRPWYILCTDLLGTVGIKVCFYMILVTVLIANIISIILQRVSFSSGVLEIALVSVDVADITVGIYMSILWIADLSYAGFVI